MKYYMAPMEGITGYIYRNAFAKYYGGIDRYFAPFISSKKLGNKEKNDLCPENNIGIEVIPQVLTNKAEDFLSIANIMQQYGYKVINLNLGCPSGTVVAKGRGAGFLAEPEKLDNFLEEIFEKCPIKISIKTRIGKESADEWNNLLEIYQKYPLEELIVHPRVQTDFYKNDVNINAFRLAAKTSRHSLCYNGEINTADDSKRLQDEFKCVEKQMIGRGLIRTPWLIEEINGFEKTEEEQRERFREFHNEILQGYCEYMSGDRNVLFKMKDLWTYWSSNFEDSDKCLKKIRKCRKVSEYESIAEMLFIDWVFI